MWALIPHSEILAPDFCYKNVVANRFMITTDVRAEIYIRRMWKATYTVAKQHHHPRGFLVHGNLSSCSWSGPLPRKLLTGRGDNETILSARLLLRMPATATATAPHLWDRTGLPSPLTLVTSRGAVL